MTEPKTPQGETPQQPTEPVVPVEPTQPAASVTPASEPTEEPFDKERAMNTIRQLREVEKQSKATNKELEQLRAEKKQREEAEMTEAQRLQKQTAELQEQNSKLQASIWRTEAAAAANLPSIFANRVQGATQEEMLADAKKLAEALPKQSKAPTLNATNPANSTQTETPAQQRERLFGPNINPFDIDFIRGHGGGVVEGKQTGQRGDNYAFTKPLE